jgi:hypothetical protein
LAITVTGSYPESLFHRFVLPLFHWLLHSGVAIVVKTYDCCFQI